MGLHADVCATFTAEGAAPFEVDAAVDVAEGETLVVLGPSGSGKTLLLETIAGVHGHEGRVTLDGRRLDDAPPETRGFGFVFQDYALFPHLSAAENVAYGQRYLGPPWRARARALLRGDDRIDRLRRLAAADGRDRRTRLRDLLRLRRETPGPDPESLLADLGVAHLADRRPPTLSGGEAQRVALARALAVDPEVLLLDEPLASLDAPTRASLRDDLAAILSDVTAVHVTHNRTTARALADRIAVMWDGTIRQTGTPETVFERPATPDVARFTGANCVRLDDVPELRDALDGDHVAVRPEAVRIDPADTGDDVCLEGRVERVVREDAAWRVTVAVGDATLAAFADEPPAAGDAVTVALPRSRLHAI